MEVHKNIRVKGKVQGVFYRASTVDAAKSLGLKGFVRNEPDGSVYIEVEGPKDQVDQLIEWSKRGPSNARVESVTVDDNPLLNFTSFEIRR